MKGPRIAAGVSCLRAPYRAYAPHFEARSPRRGGQLAELRSRHRQFYILALDTQPKEHAMQRILNLQAIEEQANNDDTNMFMCSTCTNDSTCKTCDVTCSGGSCIEA